MENEDNGGHAGGQYLTFDLGGERYAVDVTGVEVVLEMASVTRVPKSPPHLRGVTNHRGSVIPVVVLRTIFGMERSDLDSRPAVIVAQIEYEGEAITAGVLADTVYEVVELDPSAVEPSPSVGAKVNTAFLTGIGKRDGRFIMLLDLEKALTTAVSEIGAL